VIVEAELCGDHHFVADRRKRFTDEFLVDEGAIRLRRVKQGNATVMSGTDQLDHFALVGRRPIGRAHAHAAEAKSRDFEVFCFVSSP
jgi:hypothetical protein